MASEPFSKAANMNEKGFPKEPLIARILDEKMPADFSLALLISSWALCKAQGWTGESYMLHCLTVADPLSEHITLDEKIVGILHDVVEDSDWTLADLSKVGFSDAIVSAVASVTKQEMGDKKEKYLDAILRCSENPIGRKVKRRDNRHNMDLTRGPFVAGEKQKYHYHISYMYLGAVDAGEIAPRTSIWQFLMMDKYKGLIHRKNYHYIAQQTSEAPPAEIKAAFGEPDYTWKHEKMGRPAF
ncbi:MAG: hypothetical protein KGQ41_04415 [Alphaproteobacteria bacterium]|nr:hypothetical protein [Alphaproteobacteria bacterium]